MPASIMVVSQAASHGRHTWLSRRGGGGGGDGGFGVLPLWLLGLEFLLQDPLDLPLVLRGLKWFLSPSISCFKAVVLREVDV